MEKHAPDPVREPGGLRSDPGWIGSEVNAGREYENDIEKMEGDEASIIYNGTNSNDGVWQETREKKKRKAIGNKGDESEENDIKVIIRFQTPCAFESFKGQRSCI